MTIDRRESSIVDRAAIHLGTVIAEWRRGRAAATASVAGVGRMSGAVGAVGLR